MEGDDIGLGEDVFDRRQRDAQFGRALGGDDRVVGEDLHIKAGHAFGDQLADVAEADDAEGSCRSIRGPWISSFPIPPWRVSMSAGMRVPVGDGQGMATASSATPLELAGVFMTSTLRQRRAYLMSMV